MNDMKDTEKNIEEQKPETAVPEASAASVEKGATPAAPAPKPGGSVDARSAGGRDSRRRGPGGPGGRGGAGGGRRRGPKPDVPAEADYEEKNIEIARVTRVTKGGKRMRFRSLTVIGNRKGRVGFGLAKGTDVAGAIGKAASHARKSLLTVPIYKETIPHAIEAKFGSARVLLKPAPPGTGIKAGGAVRSVLELAGVPNVVSKILGSSNKVNNVKATFEALKQLRLPKDHGSSKDEAAKEQEEKPMKETSA
jgi:small subunit ribosomal protein S5